MSFPRYESYKDSGVEWLGEVPAHWDIKRLKNVADVLLSNVDKHTVDGQKAVRLCNYVDVYKNDRITSEIDFMRATASDEQIKRLTVIRGDVIITKDSEDPSDIGVPALVVEDIPELICGYHLALIRSQTSVGGFLHYLFCGNFVRSVFRVEATGMTRYALGKYSIENLEFAAPPKEEQQTIAAFLDRETAKIDALIAEQHRLIELLKEKRQAVISHAVTKGLNPDAPMKDSGIEWLGEVPVHWEVVAAKRVASVFVPQRNKPELNVEGDGIYWATMDDMKTEEILQTSLWVSEEAAKNAGSRVLNRGAVIASCVGNFGVASINSVDLIINQQLQAYLLKPSIKAEFFRYFLGVAKVYFEQVGTAATLTYVNQQGFENLPVTLPQLIEQENIISYLSFEASKFELLTTEAQRAIELLTERRTALISAAVTGKIDVRPFHL